MPKYSYVRRAQHARFYSYFLLRAHLTLLADTLKISKYRNLFFFFGRYNTGPHGSLNPISLEKVILVLSFLLLYA